MWLSFLFFIVALFILAAGVLSGGIFTLVLVPLAVIIAVAVIGYGMWARAAGGSATPAHSGVGDPLPGSNHQNTAATPATPDDLVDARQQQ